MARKRKPPLTNKILESAKEAGLEIPKQVEKNPVGRPTLYKPEYCSMVVEHMSQGFSFETFAAIVDVDRDTVNEWARVHEDFSAARRKGSMKSKLLWESLGIKGTKAEIPFFNDRCWKTNMVNRFKWADKIEVTEKEPEKMSIEDIKKELRLLLSETGGHESED